MAASKTKLAQALTPEELATFCEALRAVPHEEMAARIVEMAAAQGIQIGRSAAYEFRNKEALPFIQRIQARRQKAALLAEMGDDDSGRTLADAAAAELGQIAFDLVTDLDGKIDIQTEEGQAVFAELTKGIHRLRSGDRQMIKQLQQQLDAERERSKETAAAVLKSAKEAGASPALVGTIREALNFRPPPKEGAP